MDLVGMFGVEGALVVEEVGVKVGFLAVEPVLEEMVELTLLESVVVLTVL